jgi:hypothetical protein
MLFPQRLNGSDSAGFASFADLGHYIFLHLLTSSDTQSCKYKFVLLFCAYRVMFEVVNVSCIENNLRVVGMQGKKLKKGL